MRVVVTGGSGRLGRSVVRELVEHGHTVLNADQLPTNDNPADRFMPVDLLELGQVYGAMQAIAAEAVVHLAAHPRPRFLPEEVTFRNNTLATFNVFQAALNCGVRRVVYAGSPNVLGYGLPGWLPRYLPIDEAHPMFPWHAYHLSKVFGEQMGEAFHRQSGGRLKAFTVRPCFVVSPAEWTGEAPAQDGGRVHDRLDDPSKAGASLFNYVDARDAAQLFRLVLENEDLPSGELFYAGAADALARAPLVELIPRFYPGTEALAKDLTGTRPAFSVEKAYRLLGYEPRFSWRTELRG
jgi:nucleoside-diphosphate-sugar epimerase